MLTEQPYSFAAAVLKPWELDKLIDLGIDEGVPFPILGIPLTVPLPTTFEQLYHAPSNPCPRYTR